ncbi:ABC transporter substrate-binding protein [Sphingomonas xinjiangensis]|uniref:Iron complex transport system substrate-binding protein n=1 Tax=Sphingomonas xinjiangensis TaxID=643568 RepID=A0A840Y8L2_9SPHN|nr:ABC transporter substrate-binding protein [Sphingomonas xinjiangensis]MBB5709657.1 iron complex transport system substrate-binding protein [Sphingomonas xinjiangensis]
MRRAAFLCLVLAGCAAPPSRTGGIVSLNPCADAMLIELVAPERITAISRYSKDPRASSIPPEVAASLPATSGSAEEVITLRPSLVVASSYTAPSTREAFARAGLKTLYLDIPPTIDANKAQIRELAAAVGAPAKGDALVARIDAAVRDAHSNTPPVTALLWIGGNLATGGSTLLDEMMTKAGFSNHAAHYGLTHTGYLPIEQVLADPPRAIIAPEEAGRDADSRAAQLRKWAVRRSGAKVTQAVFPRELVNCGGPVIVPAMARLARIRREIAR